MSQAPLAAFLFGAVSILTSAGTAHAVTASTTSTETSDAGQNLPVADATAITAAPVGTSLTKIFGSLSRAGDADLYAITMSAHSTFSATTVNTLTATSGVDTALFLFNANGVAVATDDDASGTSFKTPFFPI